MDVTIPAQPLAQSRALSPARRAYRLAAPVAALLVGVWIATLAHAAGAQTQAICSLDANGKEIGVDFEHYRPATRGTGRFVIYASDYDSSSGRSVVYRHDRESGAVEPVSVKRSGGLISGRILGSTISADGRWCAFVTASQELDSTHPDSSLQVYLRDMVAGTTERVSIDVPVDPLFDAYDAWLPQVSNDGSIVVFQVTPYELPEWYEGYSYLCVRDRNAGTTELLVPTIDGAPPESHLDEPDLSDDGRFVAFSSRAGNLVAGDRFSNQDIFLLDRSTGGVELVSKPADGSTPSYDSASPRLSGDGSFVVFHSASPNLVAFDHPVTWPKNSVFLHDRALGMLDLVSRQADGDPATGESVNPTVADGGRHVAFASKATDLAGATPTSSGSVWQAYVFDRLRGHARMLSVTDRGDEALGGAFLPVICADGGTIVYGTYSDDLGAAIGSMLIAHDREIEQVARRAIYGSGWPGRNGVPQWTIDADPVLGTQLLVHVDHSAGTPYGIGFLLLGFAPACIATRHGGEVLVDAFAALPFPLYADGATFDECIDYDASLAGVALFAQVLELDASASHGVSFTQGLELHVGF